MLTKPLIESIRYYIEKRLSPERLAHSLSTATLAKDLALKHGLDPQPCELSALAHDMAKEEPKALLKRLSRDCDRLLRKAGQEGLCRELLDFPGLFHGPAADILLRRVFSLADERVLEAVRWHSLGTQGMGDVAKILFIADKLEATRSGIEEDFRLSCLSAGLNECLLRVLERGMEHQMNRGRGVAPVTRSLYNSLRGS